MRVLLAGLMALLLLKSQTAMEAVSVSCRLFVTAVLPGLLPYMVLSSMLVSRCRSRLPVWGLTALGWCGGSPTGARLMRMQDGFTWRQRSFVSAATATMSPMFLVGTCGAWLGSARAGVVMLLSGLAGGAIAGGVAAACAARTPGTDCVQPPLEMGPLTFGAAVEQAARTLLLVCGTMAMWRMFAAMAAQAFPALQLPVMTLLEVTSGAQTLAALPLPLPLRTSLLAGATGFGGAAILMQNRAVQEKEAFPLGMQLGFQAVHGVVSALLALGMMLLWEAV